MITVTFGVEPKSNRDHERRAVGAGFEFALPRPMGNIAMVIAEWLGSVGGVEVDRAVGAQLPELVLAGNGPDGARACLHDEGMRTGAAGPVPDPGEQVPVRDLEGCQEGLRGTLRQI